MATALDYIERSLRLIHVLDPDESATGTEAADSLEAFNDMIDSYNVDRGYIFSIREEPLSWPADAQSQTIGPTGDFTVDRPVRISNSTFFTDANGNDFLLRTLDTRRGYTGIVSKDTTSDIPQFIYYEPSFPNGEIFIWPVPNVVVTVLLHYWQELTQPALLTTTLSVPPGYKRAFVYSFAEEIAGEFGVAVPPEVTKIAMTARSRIRNNNHRPVIARLEVSAFRQGRTFNIFTGD